MSMMKSSSLLTLLNEYENGKKLVKSDTPLITEKNMRHMQLVEWERKKYTPKMTKVDEIKEYIGKFHPDKLETIDIEMCVLKCEVANNNKALHLTLADKTLCFQTVSQMLSGMDGTMVRDLVFRLTVWAYDMPPLTDLFPIGAVVTVKGVYNLKHWIGRTGVAHWEGCVQESKILHSSMNASYLNHLKEKSELVETFKKLTLQQELRHEQLLEWERKSHTPVMTTVDEITDFIGTYRPDKTETINLEMCVLRCEVVNNKKAMHVTLVDKLSSEQFLKIKDILECLDGATARELEFRLTIWAYDKPPMPELFPVGAVVTVKGVYNLKHWIGIGVAYWEGCVQQTKLLQHALQAN